MRPVVLALLLVAWPARAFPPITDRDFSLDLYVGTVMGSTRTVGMGGAIVALVEQATGMGANPAAPGVRPTTISDEFDWAGTVDWLNPDLGQDFDNNGDPDDDGRTLLLTGGIALEFGLGGFGFDATWLTREVPGLADEDRLAVNTIVMRVMWARTFLDERLTFGLGFRGGLFNIAQVMGSRELVSKVGWSGTAGFLWRPKNLDLRLGAALALPIKVEVPDCLSCTGFVPRDVKLPWEISVGGAWRLAKTRWNRRLDEDFRDERALTVAIDLLIVGALGDGYGLQRFVAGELQESGRSVSFSVRGGAEFEWIPGWLRVRAGSYWEPARLEDQAGRIHGTFGVEVRTFSFCFWGDRYRVRLSLTGDLASRYANGGLSIGFW